MNRTYPLSIIGSVRIPYGRHDLRRVFRRNTLLGLLVSALVHFLVVGAYFMAEWISRDESVPFVRTRVVRLSDLGPPPSINPTQAPPPIGVAAHARPSVGLPVPVPDAEVSPEQTIATQAEMSAFPSPALEDPGSGGQVEVTGDIRIEDGTDPGIDEFVPVEKAPQIIRRILPVYPEMAVRAGLEGTVWIKILIDREGVPTRAVVIKSSAELFDQPAIEAAMQFRFTPAVMNRGPVKVWVSIPFRFRLRDVMLPS